MSHVIQLNTPAPDFTLNDYTGDPVRLSSYEENKNVILVFNRGFF
jgi:peroxiredoxin